MSQVPNVSCCFVSGWPADRRANSRWAPWHSAGGSRILITGGALSAECRKRGFPISPPKIASQCLTKMSSASGTKISWSIHCVLHCGSTWWDFLSTEKNQTLAQLKKKKKKRPGENQMFSSKETLPPQKKSHLLEVGGLRTASCFAWDKSLVANFFPVRLFPSAKRTCSIS